MDLYKDYADVRGSDLAIPKDKLHQIKVKAGTQPCDVMGIHPNLPYLKQLYDEGDALMVANMGGLVEVCVIVGRVKVTAEMRLNRALSENPHMPQEQTIP